MTFVVVVVVVVVGQYRAFKAVDLSSDDRSLGMKRCRQQPRYTPVSLHGSEHCQRQYSHPLVQLVLQTVTCNLHLTACKCRAVPTVHKLSYSSSIRISITVYLYWFHVLICLDLLTNLPLTSLSEFFAGATQVEFQAVFSSTTEMLFLSQRTCQQSLPQPVDFSCLASCKSTVQIYLSFQML